MQLPPLFLATAAFRRLNLRAFLRNSLENEVLCFVYRCMQLPRLPLMLAQRAYMWLKDKAKVASAAGSQR
jgi:hypothetical protein